MKKKLLFKTLYHCASVFLILFMAISLTKVAQATDITSTGSGNWSSTTPDAPWPNGVVPVAGDRVTIANTHTVTLDVATAILTNFTINAVGTINGASNLTLTGALKIDGTWNGTGIIVMNTSGGTIDGTGIINGVSYIDLRNDVGGTYTYTILSTANLTYYGTTNAARINVNENVTVTNNGSINFRGSAYNTGNITGNDATTSIWTNAANSTLKMVSTGSGGGPLNATLVFNCSAAGNTVNYSGTSQTLRTDILDYYNLTLSGSGTPVMPPTQTVNILGDFTNSSTSPDFGTGTVNFNGTAAQNIGGSYSTNFYNLTINNSAGVTIEGNETVKGILSLTSGKVTLGDYNLTLGSSSTISGTPSASNMIVATGTGELRKKFAGIGSFTFPVGDNTYYSPVTLNFTSGSFFGSPYAGVNLKNVKNPDNTSSTDFLNRYWTVTQDGIGSFSCDVSLYYVDADIVGTEANIYCGSYSEISGWTLLNVTDTNNNILSGTVTSFSTFTGGEQSALPVELTSFTSSTSGNSVQLTWSTACELNNAGFEIERRTVNDGAEWVKIGFVQGNGTTNEPKNYSFEDKKLSTGKYNYRLKQLDYNNKATLFDLSSAVEIGMPKKFELSQNYPNPFNPFTKIDYNLPLNGNVTLKIYDISGREITTLVNKTQEAGFYTVQFNANNFASGTYFYRISANNGNNNFVMTKRMLLIK